MVEKTDRPKKAPGRSQTSKRRAKNSARKTAAAASKPKKTAARKTAAQKTAASKSRKRAATAAVKDRAIAKEELAERRIAGGQDAETATPTENKSEAPASAESKPVAAARVPQSVKRAKTEPRSRAGENGDGSPRPNTLVPTNGIHKTERRIKRKFHQNRGVMALVAATLLGIVILGEQTTPPNLTEFEQEIAASQTIETHTDTWVATPPPGIIQPRLRDRPMATPGPAAGTDFEPQDNNLNDGELVEMERLLARLDLGPSTADGVVDNQTEAAIRLYQEIAGLRIDGAPSRSLLTDIREVVKILEDGG